MKVRLLITYMLVYFTGAASTSDNMLIQWGLWLCLGLAAAAAINPVLKRLALIDTYEKERLE